MKRILLMFLLCFTMISVSGCSAESYNAIYDDDAKIAGPSENNFAYKSKRKIYNNEMNLSAKEFMGIMTLWEYTAEDDGDYTFSYSLSVSNGGKAKLVLITGDDEVIILSENVDNTITDEMQSQTVSLKEGENRIKLVGYDSPALNLFLHVEVGDWEEDDSDDRNSYRRWGVGYDN